MARQHRNYENDYFSVTTILGVLRKPGLEHWFKTNTLKFITDATLKGKTIGTQTHNAIEDFINTGTAKIESEYPDEVINALNSFMLFRKEHPEIFLELSEMALVSEKYKFNGTIDCIAKSDKDLVLPDLLLDWKSGEAKTEDKPKIFDEWKFQAASYVKLVNEVKIWDIKKAIIVAIAKDKVAYNLHIMYEEEINDCFNQVFLPCLSILKYQKGKHFYGKPIASNC
jgi:hypothetical protein